MKVLLTKPVVKLLFLALLWQFLSACTSGTASLDGAQSGDPVAVDYPIAYVKRPVPVSLDANNNPQAVVENLREPVNFLPGAELFIRDRATPSAAETNLTQGIFADGALYDVKDLDTSYDGSRMVFAMRAPMIDGLPPEEQPTWNLWEYDHVSKNLQRLIGSDITAEEGQDIAPHYLPDGRIIFASTRQRTAKAVLLDEGKPQYDAMDEDRNVPAMALHVMNTDGSDIKQITFNQSHDLAPSVLLNGKIVFSRWDNAGGNDQISLYQLNPDGTGLELLYGRHSHFTGTDASFVEFMQARQAPDGRLIVKLRPNFSTRLGGELVYIDVENFTEINQTTIPATGTSGPAQVTATPFDVRTDDAPSTGGRFANVYPLFDGSGRFLVSWTPCRLNDLDAAGNAIIIPCTDADIAAGKQEAQPLYGIWSYDPSNGTLRPIVTGQEGLVAHDVVALAPRDLATVIPAGQSMADQTLVTENVGVVHIASVYDFDGVDTSPTSIATLADPVQTTAAGRPARFIRIVKAVSLPSRDLVMLRNTAFGRSSAQGMRDILGYVMVEPDGSAMFKVPANVAFSISVLDANGRRISARHQNWITVRAGEVKQCHGCHTQTSELPHGRYDAEAVSANLGAPIDGSAFPNTDPFYVAQLGETMAQTVNRLNDFQPLSVNVNYRDFWTDPNISTQNPDIRLNYSQLTSAVPTSVACQISWSGLCRISINYIDQIQPLWELSRQEFDAMGNLVVDNTCTLCHNRVDDMGVAQQPDGQLELTGEASVGEPDHVTSYRELLFPDNAQVLLNGALVDELVLVFDANGNPVYEVDANGNLILDVNGDPIQVTQSVAVAPSMRVSGANNSPRFFNRFNAGGTHAGRLSDAELRLLSEWLDIGGQYYNNPFDVPQN